MGMIPEKFQNPENNSLPRSFVPPWPGFKWMVGDELQALPFPAVVIHVLVLASIPRLPALRSSDGGGDGDVGYRTSVSDFEPGR